MNAGKNPKRKLMVVTDAQNRIVAGALTSDDEEIRSGIAPLAGQTVHEMEVPKALAKLQTPEQLFAVLDDAKVSAEGVLQFRQIRDEPS